MNFAFYVSGNAGRLRELVKQNSKVLQNTKLVLTDSETNEDLESVLQGLGIEFHEFNYNVMKANGVKGINQKLSDYIFDKFNALMVIHIEILFL